MKDQRCFFIPRHTREEGVADTWNPGRVPACWADARSRLRDLGPASGTSTLNLMLLCVGIKMY